jgi:hypothetical protein
MSNENSKPNNGKPEDLIYANEKAKQKKEKSEPVYSLSPELKAFFNLREKPARLNTALTAACLGFQPHDIPVLAARGFLKPLGRPMPNSDKYYARARILEVAADEEWLSRATAALSQHWQNKNARKSKPTIPANRH